MATIPNWVRRVSISTTRRSSGIAKALKPSARGSTTPPTSIASIFDVRALNVERMGRGLGWLDTGTPDSLVDAASFVRRFGKSAYGQYLRSIEGQTRGRRVNRRRLTPNRRRKMEKWL